MVVFPWYTTCAADCDVKNAIFGLNAAPLYDLGENPNFDPVSKDTVDRMKAEYQKKGIGRSNVSYGYIAV